ncbi:MAG: hypothetical protein ACETVR_03780 [Candidatus Bathyarchaeia archaeon]
MDMKIEIMINGESWIEAELRDDVGMKVATKLGNVFSHLLVDHERAYEIGIRFSRHAIRPLIKTRGTVHLFFKSLTLDILYDWFIRILDEVREPVYLMSD